MASRFPATVFLALVLGMFALAGRATAEVVEGPGPVSVSGALFERTLKADGSTLRLAGAGLLRYRVVFKGYAAALYLGTGHAPDAVFGDVPKRLEIEYFHAIPAQDFRDATRQGIEMNVARDELGVLKPRLDRILAAYLPVKPHDRYSFTYLPGRGSTLRLNGRSLVTVEGLDVANAFLKIWLGPNPADRDLKSRLLGMP
ncbi:MAG TPA: chalcone isomerase family protein [Deltaproteobacteria bacterium]|nr:chalcone isomerase family protein [Deltaproteobacteria bacterium]HOM28773.1 chalcone isomerase family protein [Deltaproteobacteria bacterium]HPP80571.1 chalcone isomerase family protein [Deltaproteobacteria bacterium]